MKIDCLNGYFIFRESACGDAAKFNSYFSQDLTALDTYYTFSALVDMPSYSLLGAIFLSTTATATYEGRPWELFRENGLVYNFISKAVVPTVSVTSKVSPLRLNSGYAANGLIMPGSITPDWLRVTGYRAHLDTETFEFQYSELFYE